MMDEWMISNGWLTIDMMIDMMMDDVYKGDTFSSSIITLLTLPATSLSSSDKFLFKSWFWSMSCTPPQLTKLNILSCLCWHGARENWCLVSPWWDICSMISAVLLEGYSFGTFRWLMQASHSLFKWLADQHVGEVSLHKTSACTMKMH